MSKDGYIKEQNTPPPPNLFGLKKTFKNFNLKYVGYIPIYQKSYNLEILFIDYNNNMVFFPPLGPLCEEELVFPAPSHPALQEN